MVNDNCKTHGHNGQPHFIWPGRRDFDAHMLRAGEPQSLVWRAFAGACALASVYGFAQGAWPFGVVEAIWALVALRRWQGVATG